MTSLRALAPHLYRPPDPDRLIICFEDQDIVVVNKPPGLLSVPGRGPDKAASAATYLETLFGEIHIVHRLDMDTSGLMVVARHRSALKHLARQFQTRQVLKTYFAVVEGIPKEASGTINLPIAAYSRARPLRHIEDGGQDAITHWEKASATSCTSRLILRPKTGRSHQLRLHLSEIGHPILGDPFYGKPETAGRLLLHASQLGLMSPTGDTPLLFESPPIF